MAKIALFLLVFSMAITFAFTNISKADTDITSFNNWRPWKESCGCHSSATNVQVDGKVIFDAPIIVNPGDQFIVKLKVSGFADAAGGAITLGMNVLDFDNGLFMTETQGEANHGVDSNGDSIDWTPGFTMTAPEEPGVYSLLAYGVDGQGGTDSWVWVMGTQQIIVSAGAYTDIGLYADDAADYLIASAVQDANGLKWAEYNGTTAKFKTGYLKGAAGIGEYFLEMYRYSTSNPFFEGISPKATKYLDVAKQAAVWLMNRAISDSNGYKWPQAFEADNTITSTSANYTGMYAGAAGIGTFFLDLYRTTGDSNYLTYAEGAANWLFSMANKSHGYMWVEKEGADNSTQLSTRWTFGSPGIGGYFIDLYLATGNATYAEAANKTVEGLIYYADDSEGGYSWTRYNGNTERFVGRWHGDAGIGIFFLEMYDLYKNATYLQYAEGIADWIHSTHQEDNGYFYPDNNAATTKSYKFGGWSRSPAGIGGFFLGLYKATGDQMYLDNATNIANFLINNGTWTNGGLLWPDASDNDRIATAMGHGLAGTGMYFIQLYQVTGESKYAAMIQAIAQSVSNLAIVTPDGLAWTQSDKTSDVHVGLYYGVAGVGYFLNLAGHSGMPTSSLADEALDYLIDQAVSDSGLKWAEYNGTTAKYKTGYLKGASGIGELFLAAYQMKHGQHFFQGISPSANDYLNIAKQTADWLMARAISDSNGYKWPQAFEADNTIASTSANYTGMYAGAAGIGTFFLDIYRATGNANYLAYAEGAANWLFSMANKSHGYMWVEKEGADNSTQLSTRWTFGTPGIGGYFVNLYLATGNETYAQAANKTIEGLIYYADDSEGGYSWTRYNGNTERFVGRWHGDAGIGIFFLEMYDLYGNSTYLKYAEGIAEWIDGTHEENNGYYYPDNNATATKSYKFGGWSRSPAGIGGYFTRLYYTTSNPTYKNYVVQILEFLKNNATKANGGLLWPDASDNDRIATAMGHGLAGTGMFMLQGYRLTHDYSYWQVFQGVLRSLSNLANVESKGMSWTQSDKTTDVHMGMYYGVAGAGFFLLHSSTIYPIVDFDAPVVSSPDDITGTVDDTIDITWTLEDLYPDGWIVYLDGNVLQSADSFSSGDNITISVDTSSAGTYNYTISVSDFFGRTTTDTVIVTINAESTTSTTTTTETTTTTTETTTTTPAAGEIPTTFQMALWGSLALNIVFIAVIFILIRRK